MRIIGGTMRGLKLAEVGTGDPDAHLRPTSDRTRESIFNLLTNGTMGNLVTGATVLDLFAGTGALGFEALSRGAVRVIFVDNGTAARALLRENISLTRSGGQTTVLRRDATDLGPCADKQASLVFLDPPYGQGLGPRALQAARTGRWLAPQATIIWEDSTPQSPPVGFELIDQRRYGDTCITLLRAAE